MPKIHSIFSKINVLVFVLTTLVISACDSASQPKKESVRIGVPKQPSAALVLIALDSGLFKKANLEVEVTYYPSGKLALNNGLLKDQVDMIAASDIPFVASLVRGEQTVALASIYFSDNTNRIVARQDRSIARISDLAGHVVGTQENSAVHYFLHRALADNGLAENDVQIRFYPATQLPAALHRGDIDAFSMREPFVSQAKKLMNNQVNVMASPGSYVQSEMVLVKPAMVSERQQVVRKILAVLKEAEDQILQNPEQAVLQLAQILELNSEHLAKSWNPLNCALNMDQAVLSLLDQQFVWLQKQMGSNSKRVNMLDVVDSRHLKFVLPSAVSVISND